MASCAHARQAPDLLGGAQDKLRSARAQGAQTYAPLELRFAEERLDQAQVAVTDRKYKIAVDLAEESSVNSELASVKARLAKLREAIDVLKQQNADIERTLPDQGRVEGGLP